MQGRVRTPEAGLLAIGNLLRRVGIVYSRLGFRAAILVNHRQFGTQDEYTDMHTQV
jgi:hypothetical protein